MADKHIQLVEVRASCSCEGYVKLSIPIDEHGWITIPVNICTKCLGQVTCRVHEEDNPSLKK